MTRHIRKSLLLSLLACAIGTSHASISSGNIFGSMSGHKVDGPVTVCSNEIMFNNAQHELVYSGNVVAIQVKGVSIQCQKNGGAFPELIAKKQPNYLFWIDPESYTYPKLSQLELDKAKEICKQYKGCRYISGQKLIVKLDAKTNQVSQIKMTVNDEKYQAHYYSWPFLANENKLSQNKQKPSSSSGEAETFAEGSVIQFFPEKNMLEIVGHAKIDRGGSVFTGNKVTYNTKTRLVQVPSSGGGRSTMVIDNGVLEE